MNRPNARWQAIAAAWVFIFWCGALLLGIAGCASSQKSSSQEIIERLAKAQGGQAALEQQYALLQTKAAGQQAESMRLKAVIAGWIEALGGQRRLAAIQNAQCFLRVEEGLGHNFVRTIESADGRFRYDMMIGADSNISGGYEGGRGWQDSGAWGGGVYPGQRGDPLWSLWFLRALQLESVFPGRRLLPDADVDGHACAVLGLTPEGRSEERWFFDRQSGQLLRVVKPGGSEASTLTYSDYRTVSRIKIPFVVTVSVGGKTAVVYQRLSVKTNVDVKPGDFSPSESLLAHAGELDDLLKRNVEGGVLAGADSKSILVHATISSATNGIKTDLTVHRRKPGLILVEKESAGLGRTVSGFDGTTGWENSEILGYHVLKEGEMNDLMSLSWLGADPYLRERFPLRVKMGETTQAGRKAVKLCLRTFNGLVGKFYIDKENARLLRFEMEENQAAGMRAMAVEYSDYRAVGAGWMPFCVTYDIGGTQTVITCSSAELDVDMADALFRPRTETE